MFEVAIKSLLHDRGKLVASLAGVAFAATLLLVQLGLFVGFKETSSALVRRIGGDVWVMARGTEVLDNGETLSAATRAVVASRPCVAKVRGLVVAVTPVRKPSGAHDAVEVVGVEPDQRPLVPWRMIRGLPEDLHGPGRVAIDEHDLAKLQIHGDPLGARLDLAAGTAYVAGLTEGIRSFALYPYLFAEVATARRLTGMGPGEATYWVAELSDPGCASDVVRDLASQPDLDAHTTEDFARITEDYWVMGSGAGAALGFSALFGLVVGAVIVGQTLYSTTKEHLRELATLKAIGATRREILAFIAWQAMALAAVGALVGAGIASGLARVLSSQGILVRFSPPVAILGAVAVFGMCAVASVPSARKVLGLAPAEVFR